MVFRDEFLVREKIISYELFLKQIGKMQQRNFIVVETGSDLQEKVKIHPNGDFGINFLTSLLYPFIESYWITFYYLVNSHNTDK
mmetsp:Transcript_29853/g.29016  ORF Transcript_29853/g.29016 Transcript_29853/m.29016 type:complete len:84 (+) Transcript_29853:184-435(+)